MTGGRGFSVGEVVAELGNQQLGSILVDGIAHRRGDAHLEERTDQVVATLCHTVGEFADRNRLGDHHVADLFCLGLAAAMGAAFLFAGAL